MGGLIILAVVIIAGLVTGMFLKKRRKIINIATAGLSMLLLVFMCVSPVSAKNVGVVVTFGAVDENTRAPDINFILPWSDMIQIDFWHETRSLT